MSRPDLRAFYVSILVWSGCDLGWAFYVIFSMFCISLFWPGMVLNQGQLSIIVSDWEPYLGSFSHSVFVGSYFLFCVSAPDRTVPVFIHSLCYFCY